MMLPKMQMHIFLVSLGMENKDLERVLKLMENILVNNPHWNDERIISCGTRKQVEIKLNPPSFPTSAISEN